MNGEQLVEFSYWAGVGPGLEVVSKATNVVDADAASGLLGNGEGSHGGAGGVVDLVLSEVHPGHCGQDAGLRLGIAGQLAEGVLQVGGGIGGSSEAYGGDAPFSEEAGMVEVAENGPAAVSGVELVEEVGGLVEGVEGAGVVVGPGVDLGGEYGEPDAGCRACFAQVGPSDLGASDEAEALLGA